MSKLIELFKKSYIFIIIGCFYIPLFIAAVYSFNSSPKRGNMDPTFNPDGSGWRSLMNNLDIARGAFTSLVIAVVVAFLVSTLSLLTVFSIWRSRSKFAKGFVTTTYNVPLINPDVITGVMLAVAFGAMFGTLKFLDQGIERAIIGHIVMIIPFGITIMYPRSETFSKSMFEASRDLGYGPVRTWFKTYFRHMVGVVIAVFIISMALSFDDFIITKTTSRVSTLGTQLYATTKLRPWILALGTIVMSITLSASFLITGFVFIKNKRRKK